MLQSIRERTGIFLPVAVIGLLVVPFVISSLYGYVVGGGGPQTIATVDGVEITRSRLDQAYRERQSELRQLLGEQFDPSLFDTDQLRRETAQQLIDRAVLLNYARAQGLQATDADVAIAIRGQSIFQVDGSFSAERYRRILEQNRLTPERYESQLREDLTIDLLQRSIGQTAYTSDRELDRILALQRQRRELAWAVLPAEAYHDAVSIEESDLRAWYEQNAERYRQPQQVQLRYLHLDLDAIAADIDIPRADIEARYAEREAEANDDSLREIRHILIAVDESADTAAVEAARDRAQSARQRIIDGEGFAEVAAEISDDTGSGAQGGELGLLQRADVVPAFADAAWSLPVGELSEPVRTPFGWHVIEVQSVQSESLPPLSEIADQIRDEIARERAERVLFERGNEVDSLAFENPMTLEPAARAVSLPVQTSDWLTPAGTGQGDDPVLDDPAVLQAAFDETAIERRENSDLIELASGGYAVIRVSDYQPAQIQPFDAVAGTVRQAYVQEEAAALARADAESIVTAVKAGGQLQSAAGEYAAAQFNPGRWSERNERELPAGVREAGFRLPAQSDEPVADLARVPQGWAVVTVLAVENGDPDAVEAEAREQLRASMNNLDGQAAVQALLTQLREQANIRVFEDNI